MSTPDNNAKYEIHLGTDKSVFSIGDSVYHFMNGPYIITASFFRPDIRSWEYRCTRDSLTYPESELSSVPFSLPDRPVKVKPLVDNCTPVQNSSKDTPLGLKYDTGKVRMSLLPSGVLSIVLEVLELGAKKYAPDNWKHVENARTRYYDALHRHVEAWWNGEMFDKESGKHHLAHAICCCMFAIWQDLNKKETK